MLEITFLGGAEEVGASCAAVDVDDLRLLVDCGQRLGAAPGNALPDFSQLEFGRPIDAVLITHAHADHIGALPAFEPYLDDDCPVYATDSTYHLTKVMLQDSVRIMNYVRRAEEGIPLFPPSNVAPCLERFQSVRWGKAVRVHPDHDVFTTWYPSGHILGAGMIEIRGKAGSILFSGDVSIADQMSVSGASSPAIRPNILVLESTYGGRLHAHRPAQERRLIERVKEVFEQGGSTLFPTFALGRAQEILLLLGKAMRERRLPRLPVYADGLVRAISKVYRRLNEDLSPWCRRLYEEGLDPIFPEDLPIKAVKNDAHRQQIIHGPPAVVVSSSGMLQGGASAVYAADWIRQPKNLIILTGYQDEESPGQALLNLATLPPDQPRQFKLAGIMTDVRCHVESCWLSAHADDAELTSFAARLQPQLILPVHGDGEARESLAKSLLSATKSRVILPSNGGRYGLSSLEVAPPGRGTGRIDPLGFWPPWDPSKPRELDLEMFHGWLVDLESKPAWVTLDELMELWKAPEAPHGDDWELLRKRVYTDRQPYFRPDAKRPYILHLTPAENIEAELRLRSWLPVEQALAQVREAFPESAGLIRVGFFPEEGTARLEFDFPASVRQRQQRRLDELETKIGWRLEISDETDERRLLEALADALGAEPSDVAVSHEDRVVRIGPADPCEFEDDFPERFLHRTGYRIECAASEVVD
jgi:Cft2 family RNA processing exonuclease